MTTISKVSDARKFYGRPILRDNIDIIIVDGNTNFDFTGSLPNQRYLVKCINDGELSAQNAKLLNKRSTDTISSMTGGGATVYITNMNFSKGELIHLLYVSPEELWYELPSSKASVYSYDSEYWISQTNGSSTNVGTSIAAPVSSVNDILSNFVMPFPRFNMMSDWGHIGGWDLANQDHAIFQGSGVACQSFGDITVSGIANYVTFKDMVIASDITDPTQTALKIISSKGGHLLEGLSVTGNTATHYIEFGVDCYNATADGFTTFGELVCTLRDCDLDDAGIIMLPDIPSGYAYIKLENSKVSGISVGTGWFVVYDDNSSLGTLTYTGTGSSVYVRLQSELVPKSPGGVLIGTGNTTLFNPPVEKAPSAASQALMSTTDFLGNVNGANWTTITPLPTIDAQVSNQTGTNISAMLKQFSLTPNYQTYSIWVDICEAGSGSSFMSRHVYMEVDFRMDLIAGSGTVDINDFIIKDRQQGTQKGTLYFVYNSGGYSGANVQLKYDCAVAFTNLYVNIRILPHSAIG